MRMEELTIKGVITPYTPKGRTKMLRFVFMPDVLKPIWESIIAAQKAHTREYISRDLIINKRQCRVSAGTDFTDWLHISVMDNAAPPKALRPSEKYAISIYMEFCLTGDWLKLFREWESNHRVTFRHQLLKMMPNYKNPHDCESCTHRFTCMTNRPVKRNGTDN
jgi:hypothetical protein